MTRSTRIVLLIGFGAVFGAAWIIPNYIRARTVSSKNSCQTNLELIDKEKARWALENKKPGSYVVTEAELFGPTNYIKGVLHCPASSPGTGDTYILGRLDQKPRCSIPPHRVFLACAEVVDDSGRPIRGVRVAGQLSGKTELSGKTDSSGWCELSAEYDVDSTSATEQFTVSKQGYRTETVPMPELWPLRVTLKKSND